MAAQNFSGVAAALSRESTFKDIPGDFLARCFELLVAQTMPCYDFTLSRTVLINSAATGLVIDLHDLGLPRVSGRFGRCFDITFIGGSGAWGTTRVNQSTTFTTKSCPGIGLQPLAEGKTRTFTASGDEPFLVLGVDVGGGTTYVNIVPSSLPLGEVR